MSENTRPNDDEEIVTIDLNQAALKDITKLPFMSMQRARLIINYREYNGPFRSVDDVDDVPGIGERLSALIKQHFHVQNDRGREREITPREEVRERRMLEQPEPGTGKGFVRRGERNRDRE